MKNLLLATVGVTLALLVGPRVLVHAGQSSISDTRQHGFEHGYRDGADRARQDREQGIGYSFRDTDYLDGARDYDRSFGDRRQYMSGYQEGFQQGYDDGYKDRGGRYGQLYSRQDSSRRDSGRQDSSRQDSYGRGRGNSTDAAFDAGYREGIAAGQQDQQQNVRSNFRGARGYQNGGVHFQDGVERGYQDGYGRTQHGSDGGGYFPPSGRTGAADTRDGQGTPTRSIAVAANRQWTPTSITVRQGDTMRIESSGEIRFTSNASDRAITAGSVEHKLVSGAPLPGAFAGALIGRIDSGRPFGIGNQTSIVIPASGLLYLGVNDDNVGDNTGQFQVAISW